MIKKTIFPVISGLFLSCALAFGQVDYEPGYIVKNNNDTLWGFINLKANNVNCKKCEFTTDKSVPARTYYPGDIQVYKIENNKYYVSKEVTLDSVPVKLFLEYLVDGIADLFYVRLDEEDYYFLEKGGEMYRLSNEAKTVHYTANSTAEARRYGEGGTFVQHSNQYIGMLSIAFSDCPDLKNEINKTGFNYKQLIKLTKDYHNKMCSGSGLIDYTKSQQSVADSKPRESSSESASAGNSKPQGSEAKDKPVENSGSACISYSKSANGKVFLEPYLGIIYSRLGLLTSKQYDNNTNYIAGLNLRLLPARSHYLWNLLLGVNFSQNSIEKKFYHNLDDYINPVLIHADYSLLRIPISIEYTFPTGKLRPFIMATYTNSFLLNATSEARPVYEYPGGTSTIGAPYDEEIETIDFGVGGGFGLKYSNGDKGYGFLKCEYEYRLSYASFNAVTDNLNAHSIIFAVGYGFKL